jgi:ribosomal protein S18 acetylase RimI-like enzyme
MPPITLETATTDDAAAIASLRRAVARDLTIRYGKGPWSSSGTEKGVLFDMRRSVVCVARAGGPVIATLNLSTRKPWAIDPAYFRACDTPLYLTSMAVHPSMQGAGIGRQCIDEVRQIGKRWPGDGIRLDAWDAEAGAGDFYRKCGFTEVGRVSYKGTPLIYFELMLRDPCVS